MRAGQAAGGVQDLHRRGALALGRHVPQHQQLGEPVDQGERVRSSWETVEIRADLTSSISRSLETSRITSTPPTTRPRASKMGAEETATGTRRP